MQDTRPEVEYLRGQYEDYQKAVKLEAKRIHTRNADNLRNELEESKRHHAEAFARKLKAEYDRGMTVGEIQRGVLKTADWGRWVTWRDLAGIAPRNKKREEMEWF